jgi:hypothetical protein
MRTFDNDLANIFAMLHPATLPMLKRLFEDFRRDAEDDGHSDLVARAERAISAVLLVMNEDGDLTAR